MDEDRMFKTIIGIWIASAVIVFACLGVFVFIGLHFVAKFW